MKGADRGRKQGEGAWSGAEGKQLKTAKNDSVKAEDRKRRGLSRKDE